MKILQILKNRDRVLGQNSRNLNYIKKPENIKAKKFADNKLLTKKILIENNIPTPDLLGVIRNMKEFNKFNWESLPKSFVMKPVHGSQGGGIEIFFNKDNDGNWIRSDGTRVSLVELKSLAQDILDGKYSLGGGNDQIFFEERVRNHKSLINHSYKGAPDVRLVLYNQIPVLAYIRFPTKESEGRANMILGAVGTGIDIASGITTTSTYGKANGGKGEPIEFVPGTKLRYRGLKIPYWTKLLRYGIQVQKVTGFSFLAVDFLIDQEKGPLIVELNARPGLSIQLVNRTGLAWRLKKIKGLDVKTLDQGIRLGKDLFGGEVEGEIEKISGKEIISNFMPITIKKDDKKIKKMALIDTGRRTSIITKDVAKELGIPYQEIEENEIEYVDVRIKLGSQEIDSRFKISRKTILDGYKVLIGRRDLSNYIIDIHKVDSIIERDLRDRVIKEKKITSYKKLDEELLEISKDLAIIPALRPLNIEEEKENFFKKEMKYNPKFKYKPIRFDPDDMLTRLNALNPPNDQIGMLYKSKIKEFKKVILLLESVGISAEKFTDYSIQLFGKPDEQLLESAYNILKLKNGKKDRVDKNRLSNEYIKIELQKLLDKYSIDSKIIFTKKVGKASISKVTGKIRINPNYYWTQDDLNGLIAHEILTHLLRTKNGAQQEYGIFFIGTSEYIQVEEGLATIMKYSMRDNKIMRIPALLYVLIYESLKSDFISVYKKAYEYIGDQDIAWKYAIRVKRGIVDTSEKGAFTKDLYFLWAVDFLNQIGKIEKKDSLKYIFNAKCKINEIDLLTNKKEFDLLNYQKIKKLQEANNLL